MVRGTVNFPTTEMRLGRILPFVLVDFDPLDTKLMDELLLRPALNCCFNLHIVF